VEGDHAEVIGDDQVFNNPSHNRRGADPQRPYGHLKE
jgi:hypothetical protein